MLAKAVTLSFQSWEPSAPWTEGGSAQRLLSVSFQPRVVGFSQLTLFMMSDFPVTFMAVAVMAQVSLC